MKMELSLKKDNILRLPLEIFEMIVLNLDYKSAVNFGNCFQSIFRTSLKYWKHVAFEMGLNTFEWTKEVNSKSIIHWRQLVNSYLKIDSYLSDNGFIDVPMKRMLSDINELHKCRKSSKSTKILNLPMDAKTKATSNFNTISTKNIAEIIIRSGYFVNV